MILNEDIDNYIYISSRNIIKSIFNIDIEDNLNKYYSILDNSKIYEMEKYKFHGLISPTVFNICFFTLTRDYNIDEKFAIESLRELVEKNKSTMEIIIKPINNKSSISQKNSMLDRINLSNSVEEINNILDDIKFNKDEYLKLVEKNSYQKLRYDEIIKLLIYKAKGIDKVKYENNYYSTLKEILELVSTRSNNLIDYKQKNNTNIKDKGIKYNKVKCPRCGGRGYIDYYEHIDDGICFACQGKGKLNIYSEI